MSGARANVRTNSFVKLSSGLLQLSGGVALDATLRNLVDQVGTASQLFLSTTQVNIGGGSSLGRLTVRGDGTNPIGRFESASGSNILTISQAAFGGSLNFDGITLVTNTSTLNVTSPLTNTANAVGTLPTYNFTQGNDNSTTASISNFFRLTKTINPSTGSASFRNFIVEYTINASGVQSGTTTGMFLNATENNLNGMSHNLMDLQVGGVSRIRIDNSGVLTVLAGTFSNNISIGNSGNESRIASNGAGILGIYNSGFSTFNRLQFGGISNLFSSIKRNGAGLDFRLADDSGYCQYTGRVGNYTTTVKNALTPVAAGTFVYDTTLNKLSVYNGSAWETITSV